MTQPPIPPPLPRSQMNSILSFRAGQHSPRRVESNAADVAARIARGQRRTHLVELVEQLPQTAPMHMPAQASAIGDADVELCAHCRHSRRTHEKGKDTPIPCTAPRCPCRGFDDGGIPVPALLLWMLTAALAAFGVVLAVFGLLGVAILVAALTAITGGLAWIYSAPNHHGGR